MRDMKASGIPWIGEIPAEWLLPEISHYTSSRSGGTPNRQKSEYWKNGTIPWMASGEVNKIHVYETNEKITELATKESSAKILPKNSVMVALNGQGKTKGMSAILHINAACNQSLCAFSCDEKNLHYRYLFYCLKSMYKYLRSQSGDDVRDGLAASFVKKQRIPLPPLDEQRRIADFLDAACAAADAYIARSQAVIGRLLAYKKSVITEAVTQGLAPDAPRRASGIDWIGDIPAHWNVSPLKYNYEALAGATPKSAVTAYWNGDIRWITPADYKTDDVYVSHGSRTISSTGYDSCGTNLLPVGSIVFSKRAPIGAVAITTAELCTNQGCLGLVARNKNVSNKYFYYVLSVYTEIFDLYGSGTTFKEISATSFVNIKLPLPPIEEQRAIAEFLDAKCAAVDAVIARKRALISKISEYKRSLIYEAVTGKREV